MIAVFISFDFGDFSCLITFVQCINEKCETSSVDLCYLFSRKSSSFGYVCWQNENWEKFVWSYYTSSDKDVLLQLIMTSCYRSGAISREVTKPLRVGHISHSTFSSNWQRKKKYMAVKFKNENHKYFCTNLIPFYRLSWL